MTGLVTILSKNWSQCPWRYIYALPRCAVKIENSKWEPRPRLAKLPMDQPKNVSRMDKAYLPILQRLLDDQDSDESEQQQSRGLLRFFGLNIKIRVIC